MIQGDDGKHNPSVPTNNSSSGSSSSHGKERDTLHKDSKGSEAKRTTEAPQSHAKAENPPHPEVKKVSSTTPLLSDDGTLPRANAWNSVVALKPVVTSSSATVPHHPWRAAAMEHTDVRDTTHNIGTGASAPHVLVHGVPPPPFVTRRPIQSATPKGKPANGKQKRQVSESGGRGGRNQNEWRRCGHGRGHNHAPSQGSHSHHNRANDHRRRRRSFSKDDTRSMDEVIEDVSNLARYPLHQGKHYESTLPTWRTSSGVTASSTGGKCSPTGSLGYEEQLNFVDFSDYSDGSIASTLSCYYRPNVSFLCA